MKYLHKMLIGAALFSALPVLAKDTVNVMLDWFANPDHAALIVAKQKISLRWLIMQCNYQLNH